MIFRQLICRRAQASGGLLRSGRCLSSLTPDSLNKPVQSYVSASHDPHLNLSIEYHLLQRTPPESTILFLYVNRPSIIIGRNQNPWLEVNLALLDPILRGAPATEPPGIGKVELIRRRSGGGTVFHDEGNVNWTVITPSSTFTRDKHAEMVVRALRNCGIDRSRVNERHDIVLDQGPRTTEVDASDTHTTPYQSSHLPKSLKVSGSAYKLTRGRALHHGTCLLSSPNLNIIPNYLHSPAKPFITARGVESVSSPVGNISLKTPCFMSAVQVEFAKMYHEAKSLVPSEVGKSWESDESIRKEVDELKSHAWTYLQTPEFTLSTGGNDTAGIRLELTARHGALVDGWLINEETSERHDLSSIVEGHEVHKIGSWDALLQHKLSEFVPAHRSRLVHWLNTMLPEAASAERD